MVNILLLDDENNWMKKTYNELSYFAFLTDHDYRFFFSHTLDEAKKILSQNKIHLIISDIELENENAISFLKQMSQELDIIIIYLTNYDAYALQSFGLNVYQYILKSDLNNQAKKIIDFCEEHFYINGDIQLKTKEQRVSLKYHEIYYIECHLRDIIVFTSNNQYQLTSYRLREIYDRLPRYFIMISRNTIINVKKIKQIEKDEVLLEKDIILNISRRRKKQVLERYIEFLEIY